MLEINFGNRNIKTERPAFVMGILNATPDSFWAESRGGVEKAFQIINQGADMIDIGGESTRPGFSEVSSQEQIDRIIPIILEIRKKSDIPISIDTRDSKVIKAAFEAGADVLNDVSALEDDLDCAKTVKEYDGGVILMHRFRESENRESVKNITEIVIDYLQKRVNLAISSGIDHKKIIIDPGIGFGKTTEENIQLIKEISKLCKTGYPVLMALSRKRCIGAMLNRENSAEMRLSGTLTANLYCVNAGAKILRVHDVQETVDSLNVMKYLG